MIVGQEFPDQRNVLRDVGLLRSLIAGEQQRVDAAETSARIDQRAAAVAAGKLHVVDDDRHDVPAGTHHVVDATVFEVGARHRNFLRAQRFIDIAGAQAVLQSRDEGFKVDVALGDEARKARHISSRQFRRRGADAKRRVRSDGLDLQHRKIHPDLVLGRRRLRRHHQSRAPDAADCAACNEDASFAHSRDDVMIGDDVAVADKKSAAQADAVRILESDDQNRRIVEQFADIRPIGAVGVGRQRYALGRPRQQFHPRRFLRALRRAVGRRGAERRYRYRRIVQPADPLPSGFLQRPELGFQGIIGCPQPLLFKRVALTPSARGRIDQHAGQHQKQKHCRRDY